MAKGDSAECGSMKSPVLKPYLAVVIELTPLARLLMNEMKSFLAQLVQGAIGLAFITIMENGQFDRQASCGGGVPFHLLVHALSIKRGIIYFHLTSQVGESMRKRETTSMHIPHDGCPGSACR